MVCLPLKSCSQRTTTSNYHWVSSTISPTWKPTASTTSGELRKISNRMLTQFVRLQQHSFQVHEDLPRQANQPRHLAISRCVQNWSDHAELRDWELRELRTIVARFRDHQVHLHRSGPAPSGQRRRVLCDPLGAIFTADKHRKFRY